MNARQAAEAIYGTHPGGSVHDACVADIEAIVQQAIDAAVRERDGEIERLNAYIHELLDASIGFLKGIKEHGITSPRVDEIVKQWEALAPEAQSKPS